MSAVCCACRCCGNACESKKTAATEEGAPGGLAEMELVIMDEPDVEMPADGPCDLKETKRRGIGEQVKLLAWKAYLTKTRDRTSAFKQIAGPAFVFGTIWLLYVAGGLTFVSSLRWNSKNPNFDWKDGKARDYDEGQFLAHGELELFLGFLGFIPFVQVVVVALVNEHQSKLGEYMKMAGLRGPAYWLANFLAEGVVAGFCAALLVAVVGAPGLFRAAGHAEHPFLVLFGLHWCYLVALTAVGFAAAALVPNALVASLFAVASQVAGVVCYFVGAWKEKASGGFTATGVWNKSVGIQRAYGLYPQFAYMLLVDGFRAHRDKRCEVSASYGDDAFRSEPYACASPYGKSLEYTRSRAGIFPRRFWLEGGRREHIIDAAKNQPKRASSQLSGTPAQVRARVGPGRVTSVARRARPRLSRLRGRVRRDASGGGVRRRRSLLRAPGLLLGRGSAAGAVDRRVVWIAAGGRRVVPRARVVLLPGRALVRVRRPARESFVFVVAGGVSSRPSPAASRAVRRRRRLGPRLLGRRVLSVVAYCSTGDAAGAQVRDAAEVVLSARPADVLRVRRGRRGAPRRGRRRRRPAARGLRAAAERRGVGGRSPGAVKDVRRASRGRGRPLRHGRVRGLLPAGPQRRG